jgi:HSP20 family protein
MLETAGREFDQIARQMRSMMDQIMQRQLSALGRGDTWTPAVNVYHVGNRLEVCVELAGVDRQAIEVAVEPGRLTVRGRRHAPQPEHAEHEPIRALAMEIDHGNFERIVSLPDEVEIKNVDAQQVNGLLWVRLPLRK